MSRRSLWIFIVALICAVAGVGALLWTGPGLTQDNGSSCPEQITGAIYTTELCGEQVNGNLYTSACRQTTCMADQTLTRPNGNPTKTGAIVSPYLNGGPRPKEEDGTIICKGQQLPDGDYYFMVTDPAGKVLLNATKSGDPEDIIKERQFTVFGGQITEYLGTHAVAGDPKLCGIRISMFSCDYFRPTPNPGGVYKVWITPVCRFNAGNDYPTGSEAWHLAGFVPRYCKTDVFKVREKGKPPQNVLAIFGHKYYDLNANGTWDKNGDQDEPPIANWRVELYRNGEPIAETCTGEDGSYYFQINNPDPGTYRVKEWIPDGDWVHTTPDYVDITIPADFDGVITPNVYLTWTSAMSA